MINTLNNRHSFLPCPCGSKKYVTMQPAKTMRFSKSRPYYLACDKRPCRIRGGYSETERGVVGPWNKVIMETLNA